MAGADEFARFGAGDRPRRMARAFLHMRKIQVAQATSVGAATSARRG